ncbi:MAG: molybdopterin converting factor subunit 1 [Magnetococcales bacterium]|nr:molybdopterin converting factor subunit 1 [Magnetococcales bacterium]
MVRLLYFSWVRERIGVASEAVTLPSGVETVQALLTFLKTQDALHASALSHSSLRVAVNQIHAQATDPVADGDEIAIFPPLSGG